MDLLFGFLFLTFTGGPVFSDIYKLDARDDAGTAFGQSAYAQFVGTDSTIYRIDPTVYTTPPATKGDVVGIAQAMNIGWTAVEATGNIWSTTGDHTVGDTYTFGAGTYRIAVVGGGFLYDSFKWSDWQNEPPAWKMNIRAQVAGDSAYSDKILGPFLSESLGEFPLYTDVTLKSAGTLSFWIWDPNSIDNSGSLTFSVTAVPAPPSLLLLAGCLPFIFVPKVRNYLAR
jgi:hypothetical protein